MTDPNNPRAQLAILAARALKAAKGDVQNGTDRLVKMVQADQKLFRALVDPIVREACYSAVTAQGRRERSIVWNPPPDTGRSDVEALATAYTLRDFQLLGGKRLGDATYYEIGKTGAFYASQGRNMAIKGRWLLLVSQCGDPDDKLDLNDAQLQMIRTRAENEVNQALDSEPIAMAIAAE